ncbi:MAG TPA: cell envelope integrity protein TolA [Gammaproteobacteria bacterium]|nr:cell envelope integrity protein TolA [Gammaproteobacteria bacterium]
MLSFVGEHKSAFAFSVVFHLAAAAALTLSVKLPAKPAVLPAPIQGVVVDQAVLERAQQQKQQAARAERERQQRVERERREAVEREKQQKLAAEQRERDRIAEQKREQERKEQAEREKAEAAKKEQERLAKEKSEREAREKREREEAAKREAAAKAQRQREKELADALAAEAEQQAAVRSGKLDEYAMMITDKIERNWNKPLSAQPGLECEVHVEQILTGEVVNVQLGRCNGDATVKDSILQAVRKASPLPKPPPPLQVERNLNVTFKPDL